MLLYVLNFLIKFIFSAESEFEKRLPRDKLFILCKYEPVRKYVRRSDYAFYQALVEVLIPDVLRPIPSKRFYLTLCNDTEYFSHITILKCIECIVK